MFRLCGANFPLQFHTVLHNLLFPHLIGKTVNLIISIRDYSQKVNVPSSGPPTAQENDENDDINQRANARSVNGEPIGDISARIQRAMIQMEIRKYNNFYTLCG